MDRLNQVMLWVAVFLPFGLGVPEMVRTGAVSLEMLRPLDFHLLVISRELGTVWYNLWYRTAPLALVFTLVIGVQAPQEAVDLPLAPLRHAPCSVHRPLPAVSRGAHQLGRSKRAGRGSCSTRSKSCSPGLWCRSNSSPRRFRRSPASCPSLRCITTRPASTLDCTGAEALVWPVVWAVLLTIICRLLTGSARRRLEVQGG